MEGSAFLVGEKTYLWLEDREGKSGYIFWQTLMKQMCPPIVVESKENNSELVKAVKALEDAENRYIVVKWIQQEVQNCSRFCSCITSMPYSKELKGARDYGTIFE